MQARVLAGLLPAAPGRDEAEGSQVCTVASDGAGGPAGCLGRGGAAGHGSGGRIVNFFDLRRDDGGSEAGI